MNFTTVSDYFNEPIEEAKENTFKFLKKAFTFLLVFNLLDVFFSGMLFSLDKESYYELNPAVAWLINKTPFWLQVLGIFKLIIIIITFYYFKHLVKINKFSRYIKHTVFVMVGILTLVVSVMFMQTVIFFLITYGVLHVS